MGKSVEATREEFAAIRAGRANPAMFAKITADYYGTQTPLQQLASFTSQDARTILIQPFDIYIQTEDAYHLVCPTGRAEEPKIAAFKNWILDEAAKAEAEKTNAPRTRSRARGAA